jgi:hypothetical protein
MWSRVSACLLFLVAAVEFGGCALARGPVGFLYNDTQTGVAVASNQAGGRVGQSCANSILGLFATGDASIETARRNGAISMITSVDEHSTSVLGVYSTYCTIVRGR